MNRSRELSRFWIQQKLKMRVLETERLLLREFCQDDINDVAAWSDPAAEQDSQLDAQAFLDFCFDSYRKWGMGPWGMLLKRDGIVVGNCGFCHIDFKENLGEVNYFVAESYRQQGLASEALQALLRFGFEDIGLSRIQARCGPDNSASERVLRKVGMRFQATSHKANSNAEHGLEKLYVMTREQFPKESV